MIEETDPSGRVVRNTLDADGDLALVQSRKSTNGFVKYAQGFTYNSAGAVEKLHLGNGRWETAVYNSRLQVTQLGLGSTDSTQNILKLEFDYNTNGLADNNGSMLSQKMTVPTVGTNPGFTAQQTYREIGVRLAILQFSGLFENIIGMARRMRVEVEGGLYHVITRGVDRQDIFHCPEDYAKFIRLLAAQKKRLRFYLYAYCLMTNHVHLLN